MVAAVQSSTTDNGLRVHTRTTGVRSDLPVCRSISLLVRLTASGVCVRTAGEYKANLKLNKSSVETNLLVK